MEVARGQFSPNLDREILRPSRAAQPRERPSISASAGTDNEAAGHLFIKFGTDPSFNILPSAAGIGIFLVFNECGI